MSAAPSPVRRRSGVGADRQSRGRHALSGTKSATCRLTCRPPAARVCLTGSSTAWAAMPPIKSHVRVIAATHQNPEQRVEGGFREDLFHRLSVIRLRLPALRERHADVPMLTRHFLQQSARQLGWSPNAFRMQRWPALEQFSFPGNVRQLENICHWLTVMAPARVISLQDLPPEVLEAPLVPGRRARCRYAQPGTCAHSLSPRPCSCRGAGGCAQPPRGCGLGCPAASADASIRPWVTL